MITNLPRSTCFKIGNVIPIGMIPNLEHEPSTTIVDEVLEAWNKGVEMKNETFKMCCNVVLVVTRLRQEYFVAFKIWF